MKLLILSLVVLMSGCSTSLTHKEKFMNENGEQYMITVKTKKEMNKEFFLEYSKFLAENKKRELASN